jgi:hypothetical protein
MEEMKEGNLPYFCRELQVNMISLGDSRFSNDKGLDDFLRFSRNAAYKCAWLLSFWAILLLPARERGLKPAIAQSIEFMVFVAPRAGAT